MQDAGHWPANATPMRDALKRTELVLGDLPLDPQVRVRVKSHSRSLAKFPAHVLGQGAGGDLGRASRRKHRVHVN